MRALEQVAHLLINLGCNLIRVIDGAAATHLAEGVTLFLAVLHGAQVRREAILGEHGASDLGGVFDIGRSTGGRCTEDQLLGCAAAHGKDQAGEKLVAGVHALVIFLRGHGVAAGTATGQDGDLVDPLDVFECPRG